MSSTISNGTLSGGLLSPFLPSALNPDYWRNPNDEGSVVKDGGNKVSEVVDKTGNAYNLTQGNGTQQGIWTPGAVNSRAAILYDGVDDLMASPYLWPLQFHIFIIIRPTRVTGVNTIISSYDGSGGLSSQGEYILDVRSGASFLFQAFGLSPPISGAPSGGVLPNTTYLIELKSNASKFAEMIINDEAIDDGTHATSAATKPMYIAGNTSGTANTYKGYFGEEVGFSSVLSSENRAKMLSYMAGWGY